MSFYLFSGFNFNDIFLLTRLVCKFEGTQVVLDSTGVEYEEFKDKFTGESFNKKGGGVPGNMKTEPHFEMFSSFQIAS